VSRGIRGIPKYYFNSSCPTLRCYREQRGAARCSRFAGNWLRIFSELPAYYLFDHAIYKMPKNHMGTPWHQDQAYLGPNTTVRSVHFWVPFQDTCEGNGTLLFADQKPEGLLPHKQADPAVSGLLCVSHAPTVTNSRAARKKGRYLYSHQPDTPCGGRELFRSDSEGLGYTFR
jgi:hypothetical protein